MNIQRTLEKMHKGEKGFTLIELLVVVAILGILAAVIILNVMGMIGSGTVEAANTEAHNIQIAVLAGMVDNNVFALAGGTGGTGLTVGPGETDDILFATGITAKTYFTGTLEATYTFDTTGKIASAETATGGKWASLDYDPATGWVEPTA